MRALVTGATGCIGYTLAARLGMSGDYDEVRALVRPGRENYLPSGVRAASGTLDNSSTLLSAAKGVDIVFHCAAKVHDANGDPDTFFRVNRDGTQNLLNACSAQNTIPPRFVFFSTVAVYGDDTPPDGLPENASLRPQTPYAASKVEAETLVCDWGSEKHPPVYVLRVATVYGSRDRGNLGRMMKAIARNRFLMIGSGKNRKTCANVQNVVSAAIAISKQEMPAHGAMVVADPEPYTLQELHDAMAAALIEAGWTFPAHRFPAVSLPLPVALTLSAGLTGAARLARRNSPLTPSQVRRLASDNVYQAERLSAIAGYFPQASLSQGMVEMAHWLIAEGQIR